MCYSAMVLQDMSKLGLRYKARIDQDQVEATLEQRARGEAIKLPFAFDVALIERSGGDSAFDRKLQELALRHFDQQVQLLKKDRDVQMKRLHVAETKLLTKSTKTAENDKRIATDKLIDIERRLRKFAEPSLTDGDSRIYPKVWSPIVASVGGERLIRLARYQLRPAGDTADFDKTHDGCYNARQDSLERIGFWHKILDAHHAVVPFLKFYENVAGRVICFYPREGAVIVPALFDRWRDGDQVLDSFAIITANPNVEVLAAGHDRTPITLGDEAVNRWLMVDETANVQSALEILESRSVVYFEHTAELRG